MRNVLATLLLLTPLPCLASCESLEGLWEGFAYQAPLHSSHLLQLDEGCTGFYAYSFGESDPVVLPIQSDNELQFVRPHFIIRGQIGDIAHQAIVQEGAGPVLSVITSGGITDMNAWVISWKLTAVRKEARNRALYDFATSNP